MSERLKNIIADNERVLSGFVSPNGVARVTDSDTLAVEEAIIVAATDRRLILTPRSSAGTDSLTIPYDDLASATVDEEVTVRTADGTVFRCGLSAAPGLSEGNARRHLRWLGRVRSEVLGCRNDVELAAGQIERRADDRDWEGAIESYEQARQQLDETLATVLAAELADPTALAPELATAGRALERAHARLYVRRASSQLTFARQLLETDAHEQCRTVIGEAQEYAAQARRCGLTAQRDDGFQFGEQRELQRELDELRWDIGAFATELLVSARDACLAAAETPTRSEAITHYREALDCYGNALALDDARENRQFLDSPASVRRERDRLAALLIDLHERIADDRWSDGIDRQEAGERDAAIWACLDAESHFESARELAAEFVPERRDAIVARLDTIADVIEQLRTAEDIAEHPPETDDGDGRSVSELMEIDTHYDLVFEADGLADPHPDERRDEEDAESEAPDPEEMDEQASPDEPSL